MSWLQEVDIDGDDITEGMLKTLLRLRREGDERLSDKSTVQKLQKLKESLTSKEKVSRITLIPNKSVAGSYFCIGYNITDLYHNDS